MNLLAVHGEYCHNYAFRHPLRLKRVDPEHPKHDDTGGTERETKGHRKVRTTYAEAAVYIKRYYRNSIPAKSRMYAVVRITSAKVVADDFTLTVRVVSKHIQLKEQSSTFGPNCSISLPHK